MFTSLVSENNVVRSKNREKPVQILVEQTLYFTYRVRHKNNLKFPEI